MPAKFIRVWFFLSYLITTVKVLNLVTVHAHDRNRNVPTELQKLFRPNVQTRKKTAEEIKLRQHCTRHALLRKERGNREREPLVMCTSTWSIYL